MGKQLCEMHRARRRARMIATALLVASVAIATATVLAVYLVFRPMKPQASVVRAAVYHMAVTAGNSSEGRGPPYTLAASVRFTTLLHNPSDRATVFYDNLFAYVAQALKGDCAAHRVELLVVVMGRVKYRSGPLMTRWRGLYLRCDVTVGLGVGGDEAGDVPLLEYPKCSVNA